MQINLKTFYTTIVLSVLNGISRDGDDRGQFLALLYNLMFRKSSDICDFDTNPRCLYKEVDNNWTRTFTAIINASEFCLPASTGLIWEVCLVFLLSLFGHRPEVSNICTLESCQTLLHNYESRRFKPVTRNSYIMKCRVQSC